MSPQAVGSVTTVIANTPEHESAPTLSGRFPVIGTSGATVSLQSPWARTPAEASLARRFERARQGVGAVGAAKETRTPMPSRCEGIRETRAAVAAVHSDTQASRDAFWRSSRDAGGDSLASIAFPGCHQPPPASHPSRWALTLALLMALIWRASWEAGHGLRTVDAIA
jgi:hypothetical protein